jgi:predicted nucleic acid-binding protein
VTGYLLDTDVISAFAPGKVPLSADLADWLETQTNRLFLSAVSVVEIEAGIAKRRRTVPRRAQDLAVWFGRLLDGYGDKVLALDLAVARIAGAITDRAKASGHDPGFADIVIAATAEAHGLVVLTRNRRHFEPLGVALLDPFLGPLPPEGDSRPGLSARLHDLLP